MVTTWTIWYNLGAMQDGYNFEKCELVFDNSQFML